MMYDGDMDDKQNTLGLQLAGIDLIIEAFSALMELQGSEVRQTASGPSFWNWRDMNGRRDFSISPSPNIPGGSHSDDLAEPVAGPRQQPGL